MKVREDPDLLREEKETHVNIFYEEVEPVMIVDTLNRTGINWLLRRLGEGYGEVVHDYRKEIDEEECLCGLTVQLPPTLIAFKSKPRKNNKFSSMFF